MSLCCTATTTSSFLISSGWALSSLTDQPPFPPPAPGGHPTSCLGDLQVSRGLTDMVTLNLSFRGWLPWLAPCPQGSPCWSLHQNPLPFQGWIMFPLVYRPHLSVYLWTLGLPPHLTVVRHTALNMGVLYLFESPCWFFWIYTWVDI